MLTFIPWSRHARALEKARRLQHAEQQAARERLSDLANGREPRRTVVIIAPPQQSVRGIVVEVAAWTIGTVSVVTWFAFCVASVLP